MAKYKRLGYALSAAAIFVGSGVLAPGAFADEGDPFCIEDGECYATLQEAFDVVPNDGTLTTIYLNSEEDTVYDGGGAFYTSGKKTTYGTHPANSNYNVVFDLKGKTYVVSRAPVGSTGYETQAFHLERGGKFTFKDGTVKASSDSGVWFLLQNYADTTLDNVILDGSDNANITYVASNNFGSLTVKGDSQILASEGNVAFDLWYGMSAVYDNGITVTFGDDFTGKVSGVVEYGHHSRVTDEEWQERAVLNIAGGEFDTEFQNGSTDALDGANIKISGGVFTTEPDGAYIEEGYVVYESEDGFVVFPEIGVAEVKDKINEDRSDENAGNKSILNNAIEEVIAGIVKKYADIKEAAGGSNEYTFTLDDGTKIEIYFADDTVSALLGGADFSITLGSYSEIDDFGLDFEGLREAGDDEMVDAIEEVLDDDAVVVDIMEYYIDIDNSVNGYVGAVTELPEELTIIYNLPEVAALADGSVRAWQVVRYHDGVAEEIDSEYDEEANTLTFASDKFSVFTIAYTDTEEEEATTEETATPETGTVTAAGASARTAAMVTAIAVGVITSTLSFMYLIRRK